MNIEEIINEKESISQKIEILQKRTVTVPSWGYLSGLLNPASHKVMTDVLSLRDKENGEKSARVAVGLEKLLVSRLTGFTFAISVKRKYNTPENDTQGEIQKALEKIYEKAHIDNVNFNRGEAYFASCEIFTIWYSVKKPNSLYGFQSNYKLKCKTYSPKDNVRLYPIIDEYDDMQAMSFEYDKVVSDKETITIFETFTENYHYVWKKSNLSETWEEVTARVDEEGNTQSGEEIIIHKIPGAYMFRSSAVYEDLDNIRSEYEYNISRNSNVIAYNSAPIAKVKGGIVGKEKKGESLRIWRVENDGDISYVSWNQSQEAVSGQNKTLLGLYWMLSQMPDISFENMKSLGNIGYDARQTLLTDAHLKVRKEAGPFKEFFEREFNVIKAFLKVMNPKWEKELDNITCEHIITPYIPKDESYDITIRQKANGGKPVESQLESIVKLGQSKDPMKTIDDIHNDELKAAALQQSAFAMSEQTI